MPACAGAVLLAASLAGSAVARPVHVQLDNGIDATIYPPDYILDNLTERQGDETFLVLDESTRYHLITKISDPSVANKGDGQFHPMSLVAVVEALRAIRLRDTSLEVKVYVLPYPRREVLDSSAHDGAILLTPGVRPVSDYVVHFTVTHEIGHLYQYRWMPDESSRNWARYAYMRGISDRNVYSSTSAHANRPHEIFAEDFRALFGGPPAVQSGTIENPRLTPPEHVAGLDRFMLGLAGVRTPARDLTASRNPARGAMSFSRVGETASPLELFDVTGRLVTTLEAVVLPGSIEWRWNGRDRGGLPLTGAVFARVQGGRGAALKVMVLPSR